MGKEPIVFTPSVFDAEMKLSVSPENLPYYAGEGPCVEIDEAFRILELLPSNEQFYRAIGVLVFHARHLLPHQHADLARIVSTPYVRPKGKPRNLALQMAADWFVEFEGSLLFGETEESFKERAPKEFKTSKEMVRRALRDARKRAQQARDKKVEAFPHSRRSAEGPTQQSRNEGESG